MSRLTKENIDYIRNSADIVDVVSSFIPLTKRGKNSFGVCPFHDDKDPSLSVSSEKQIYKCFSCGATGNVFTFLMDYEHITFHEAVRMIADKSGIEVDFKINKKEKKVDKFYEIYNTTQKFYHNNINTKEGIKAKDYLLKRNIDDSIIKEFGIGLALKQYTMLTDLLTTKSYLLEDLIKIGLTNKNNHGYNDVFYNRIMFPITDLRGRIIAYSGRVYNGENDAKYINTKETPIFKKGELLFNYHRAKDECRLKKTVIVLEGFMDVIRLYANSIKNTVATMGTAITKEQALLIKKIAKEVIICFDGDKAGAKATIACIDELNKIGVIPKVIRLEDNLDPDDYIKIKGIDKFIEKLENPINVMDFKIDYHKTNKDLTDNFEMASYINELLKDLSKIEDDILKELSLKKISEESGLSVEVLKQNLNKIKSDKNLLNIDIKAPIQEIKKTKYHLAEQYLLYYMLRSEEVIKIYRRKVNYLPTYDYRTLAFEINEFYERYKYFDIADFFSEINENEKSRKRVSDILKLELKDEYTLKEIEDYINVIYEYNKKQEFNRLKEKLKMTSSFEDRIKIAEQIRQLKMEE